MITYHDLVSYTQENHVRWDTDLFEVLRGFFSQYSPPLQSSRLSSPTQKSSSQDTVRQEILFKPVEFREPEGGEYTVNDLINLFNT
jgi:hypothetical protein